MEHRGFKMLVGGCEEGHMEVSITMRHHSWGTLFKSPVFHVGPKAQCFQYE